MSEHSALRTGQDRTPYHLGEGLSLQPKRGYCDCLWICSFWLLGFLRASFQIFWRQVNKQRRGGRAEFSSLGTVREAHSSSGGEAPGCYFKAGLLRDKERMAPHVIEEVELSSERIDEFAEDAVWPRVRNEAKRMAEECPGDLDEVGSQLLPSFIEFTVLQWGSLEECLATHLSEKLAWRAGPAEQIYSILLTAFRDGKSSKGDPIRSLLRKDLIVIKERDPACPSLAHAVLHYKGYQGLQVYRAANWLWRKGQRALASIFHSRVSEVFGLDIHPAAQIGWGILIDHGTGVVIGETAVISDGCTLLHGVTLGGTGKQGGDRHPKLGLNVLVGAGASILGNVKVGDCAKIGAAALVLTDIPAYATAVGCPAKIIGRVKEQNPASVMDISCKQVDKYGGKTRSFCPFRKLDCKEKGYLGPNEFATRLQNICKIPITPCQASEAFLKMDTDHDGRLTEREFNDNLHVLQETLGKVVELTNSENFNAITT